MIQPARVLHSYAMQSKVIVSSLVYEEEKKKRQQKCQKPFPNYIINKFENHQ
jgi:hypothetical protein